MDERWQQGLANSHVTVLKSDQAPVFNVSMHGNVIHIRIFEKHFCDSSPIRAGTNGHY